MNIQIGKSGNKVVFKCCLILSSFFVLIVNCFCQPGWIDTTFGEQGIAAIDFDGRSDVLMELAIQQDQKIIAAGSSGHPGIVFNDFGIARFMQDGASDLNFGVAFQ